MRQNIAFVVNSHNSCTHFILACDDVVFIVICGWSLCVSVLLFFSLLHRFYYFESVSIHCCCCCCIKQFGRSFWKSTFLVFHAYVSYIGVNMSSQLAKASMPKLYIFLDKTSSEFTRMNEYYVVRSFWSCVFTHSNQTPYAFVYTKKDGFGQMNWIQNYCLGCVTTGYTMTTLNFIYSLLQNIDSIAKNVRPYVFIFECWILYAYCATYFIHFSMELPSNMKPRL